jgi:hypothetical protein
VGHGSACNWVEVVHCSAGQVVGSIGYENQTSGNVHIRKYRASSMHHQYPLSYTLHAAGGGGTSEYRQDGGKYRARLQSPPPQTIVIHLLTHASRAVLQVATTAQLWQCTVPQHHRCGTYVDVRRMDHELSHMLHVACTDSKWRLRKDWKDWAGRRKDWACQTAWHVQITSSQPATCNVAECWRASGWHVIIGCSLSPSGQKPSAQTGRKLRMRGKKRTNKLVARCTSRKPSLLTSRSDSGSLRRTAYARRLTHCSHSTIHSSQ